MLCAKVQHYLNIASSILIIFRAETGREMPSLWEKPPGKQGETAGVTGRKGGGNGNTAAAVNYNAARR